MSAAVEDAIDSGLRALGLAADGERRGRLGAYLRLLQRWNRRFNLTAVRDPLEMVVRHVLDCAAVLPFLHGRRIIDVGTGAGFPGMVLAVLDPQRSFCLLDSNGKKIRFLRQVVVELQLANVELVQERMEIYAPPLGFSTVLARAVASVAELDRRTRQLRAPDGVLIVMKGPAPREELRELAGAGLRYRLERICIPGLEAERNLVLVSGPRAGAPSEDSAR